MTAVVCPVGTVSDVTLFVHAEHKQALCITAKHLLKTCEVEYVDVACPLITQMCEHRTSIGRCASRACDCKCASKGR